MEIEVEMGIGASNNREMSELCKSMKNNAERASV